MSVCDHGIGGSCLERLAARGFIGSWQRPNNRTGIHMRGLYWWGSGRQYKTAFAAFGFVAPRCARTRERMALSANGQHWLFSLPKRN